MPETSVAVCSDLARDYLRLHLADQVGPVTLRSLLERFGSPRGVLEASVADLSRVEGVGRARADAIFAARTSTRADEELQLAAEHGARLICLADAEYPQALRHIDDPPTCLFVRGQLLETDAVALAVVGSRRCSHYGSEQARRFGWLLGSAGFTVVSGLARGIDAQSHRGAIEGNGRTIAVLGNGLASVYPPEHAGLAAEICQRGAVVSELPMLTGPDPGNFPRRNRIIVGLSLGVLVVEAANNSGALISARLAGEYNREVFAIPGRIDSPQSSGTNGLIREGGAKLVSDLQDILDELHGVGRVMQPADEVKSAAAPALSTAEQRILAAMDSEPIELGKLADQIGLGAGELLASLTMLSVKGLIRRLPGDRYVRVIAGARASRPLPGSEGSLC